MSDDKGKISADISQAAVDAALAAVEKRQREGSGAEANRVSELEKENEQLKQRLELAQTRGKEALGQLKEEHERVLRAAAELDNQKKRAQREKDDALKFGLEKFLKELLPVADNLDRALGHADADNKESIVTGVKMVAKLLEDILGKHAVKGFSAKGQAFDPRVHEAMSAVETDGPSNMVHEEFLRGYTLNDRLIRPALVSVTRAKEGAAPAPAPAEAAPAAAPAAEPAAAPAEPPKDPNSNPTN
ncbi:MAG: nucleotide exchange factor GrpE [Deltaproteobacteria bacterium]|nr:nucleotide exchange factor GrpE [Deltaproteobacteria bacterium]